MQPLQRLLAFLRQQLFVMPKRASFTSATSLISPSRASTTTWIHPGRWEHYSSARHFYQERERPWSAYLKAFCVPHKHLVSPLQHLFAAVSKHSANSCPLIFGLSLGDAASGPVLFGIIMAWQVAAIPIAGINPASKVSPYLSADLQDGKPLSPCSEPRLISRDMTE